MTLSKLAIEFDQSLNFIDRKERLYTVLKHVYKITETLKLFDVIHNGKNDVAGILYCMPQGNWWHMMIFSNDDRNLSASREIFKALKKFPLKVGDKTIVYKSHYYDYDNYSIIPSYSQNEIIYKTKTPLLLFSGKSYTVFYSLKKKFGEGEEFINALKEKSLEMIKGNIEILLKKKLGDREYKFLQAIELEWLEFDLRYIEYHREEARKAPAIFGTFKSDHTLPPMVGHRTGIGFGELADITDKTKATDDETIVIIK